MTPHTCEICEAWFLLHQCNTNSFLEYGYWEPIPDPQFSTGNEFGYWFCLTFEKAVELSEQGCNLMMWLTTLGRPDTTPECQLRAYFLHNSYEQLALDFVSDISDYTDNRDFYRRLVLCADPDDLAATEVVVKPPNLDPASIEAMKIARYWLNTCINTHTKCPKPWSEPTVRNQGIPEKMKPRRLIKLCLEGSSKKLEQTLKLSLVETLTTSYPDYAALSYCWGGDQATKLSRSNLATWFTSIPYDNLPQTIKDAARVTAGIGLEYLWIDALCIIQDDNDDKSIELAKMAEIYSHAQITLLASRSAKVEDGFLHPRTFTSENAFSIPYAVKGDQIGSVILWNGRELGASEPIDQRAWCFQERVLSHRILEFGTHLTRYRCAANRETEHPTETDGWIADSRTWAAYGTELSISLPNNWSSLSPESDEFLECWGYIVTRYTDLEMSDPRDKLNAISGIARRFGQGSNDLYCVGIWRQHLAQLLLWSASVEYGVKPKHSRIDHYIAPSWSWASTTLSVGYSDLARASIVCTVLEVSVRSSNPGDYFSNADNATLTIRAPTLSATLGWEQPPPRETCNSTPCAFGWGDCDCKNLEAQTSAWYSGKRFIVLESEIDLAGVRCECEEPVDERCDVLLVCITISRGLIVRQKCKSPETYERIGMFSDCKYSMEINFWREIDLVLV